MVTTAGRASGTAATARLTAVRNISAIGSPRSTPSTKTSPQMPTAASDSCRPNRASRFCSGVRTSSVVASSVAILPSSVAMPVATTRPRPRPWVTMVPL